MRFQINSYNILLCFMCKADELSTLCPDSGAAKGSTPRLGGSAILAHHYLVRPS